MPEQQLHAGEALGELQDILRLAAIGGSPQRLAASRYTMCREALLHSPLRPFLPGFLLQCLTIARFHDFIHLYHPSPEASLFFLEEAFHACIGRAQTISRASAFDDPDF